MFASIAACLSACSSSTVYFTFELLGIFEVVPCTRPVLCCWASRGFVASGVLYNSGPKVTICVIQEGTSRPWDRLATVLVLWLASFPVVPVPELLVAPTFQYGFCRMLLLPALWRLYRLHKQKIMAPSRKRAIMPNASEREIARAKSSSSLLLGSNSSTASE